MAAQDSHQMLWQEATIVPVLLVRWWLVSLVGSNLVAFCIIRSYMITFNHHQYENDADKQSAATPYHVVWMNLMANDVVRVTNCYTSIACADTTSRKAQAENQKKGNLDILIFAWRWAFADQQANPLVRKTSGKSFRKLGALEGERMKLIPSKIEC